MSAKLTPRAALRDARARCIRAREALVDGEYEYAAQQLDDLICDLDRVLGARVVRCTRCPATYDWPGQLDEHVDRMHPEIAPEAER